MEVPANVEINIPDAATQVALKIQGITNSTSEVWNVDDITLSGCAGSITVTPTQLSFKSIPTGCYTPGQSFSVNVSATNGSGDIDNTYTGPITLSVGNGPGNLSGTVTVNAISGTATFSNMSLDAAGTYTLSATDGSLSGASNDIIISSVCASVCPKIKSLFVDACLSTSEGVEEFFNFYNGSSSLPISSLKVQFPNGASFCNSGCGSQNWTTNPTRVASLNTIAGCAGLFVEADPIPAYAQVVVFTGANPTYSYNFVNECGTGPIYAVFANNASPVGRFANYKSTCSTRTLIGTFGSCTDQVSYDRCLLDPNDGAFIDYQFGYPIYKNEGCTPITALPIELVDFKAKYNGSYVALDWTTSSEINNNFFTLLRSLDAEKFEEIAKVSGAGNSNSLIHYQSKDENPLNGTIYYQLRQTDFDGKTSLSDVVPVTIKGKEIAFEKVIQNRDELSLTATIQTIKNDNLQIQLFDISGQLVWNNAIVSNENTTSFTIHTDAFATGIYMLKVSNGREFIVKKIKL